MNTSVLRVERLSKSFDGVRALDGVSIDVGPHEVVGVLGENGAGKSTLLKVLAGLCRPDAGEITVRGRTMRFRGPRDAAAAGISMVFQEQSLVPNLNVAENIMLGHEDAALRGGFYDWKKLHALGEVQLGKLDARIAPSALTETLSFAERQMVELAKALAIEERTPHEPLILLDEPTSMLDDEQARVVLLAIERLRSRASMILVSHRLDEVLRVCDRVYVLAGGRCVGQRHRGACTKTELQGMMLLQPSHGRSSPAPQAGRDVSAVVLHVSELSRAGRYRGVSFELRAGEVLGIAGAAGSGRESLCRALFGAEVPDSGEMVLDGRRVRWSEPADAVRHGIGYVPAERSTEGLVAGMSVAENMTLAHLDELQRGPFIPLGPEKALVRHWMARLAIQPGTGETQAQWLSGGNQQKLVLAKWLITHKLKVLILDHPWRGLDVSAKAEAVDVIHEFARAGIAMVLITESIDDLIASSDSLIVMKNGMVSGVFKGGPAKPPELRVLECML